MTTPRYSLVVPVFNEAGNITPLLRSAIDVLQSLPGETEIIIVNDGSTDNTASEIAEAAQRWPQVRALHHAQNQGQAAALLNGLRGARGEFILTMDGDGQNDPRDFPLLLAPVESGDLDLACGWRVNRHGHNRQERRRANPHASLADAAGAPASSLHPSRQRGLRPHCRPPQIFGRAAVKALAALGLGLRPPCG